jgi:uncharacterized cysteine cluster protein YcgN (CxxCxxCC family)
VRPTGRSLASLSGMEADEIQVNCSRCGKSIIVRLADLDTRPVYCAVCERLARPRNWPRLVRETDPDP